MSESVRLHCEHNPETYCNFCICHLIEALETARRENDTLKDHHKTSMEVQAALTRELERMNALAKEQQWLIKQHGKPYMDTLQKCFKLEKENAELREALKLVEKFCDKISLNNTHPLKVILKSALSKGCGEKK